ncbi:type I secretion system ATPase [Rhodovulum sp. PH10]|uniref:type I secretion system permease/ATPase n=1 Tax=Rhodovulum sp. PH10 TaxID=1187851 RepID=UPI00027C1EE8|nr:type I secretion system permease/ATPase [Rhodovulum sp. PH10]EJW09722.1 type I secretion system ATPase [Rhodovulum sp. PH10]
MTPRGNLLQDALRHSVRPLAFVFLFSAVSNVLFLAFPLYMTEVYGRVFYSQSIGTLVILTTGVLVVFLIQGTVDTLRSRVMIHYGAVFDRLLSRHVFAALFASDLDGAGQQSQALRDLDVFRQSITGAALAAVLDLPWVPIFIAILFVIDPYVGTLTLVGGLVLLALAYAQDRVSRRALQEVNEAALRGYRFTDMAVRNAEVVRALGMLPAIGARWHGDRATVISGQARASELAGLIGDTIKFVRMSIQVGVIALGAYLVLKQVFGPGVLFANMILSGKALQPLDRVVASWHQLVEANMAYRRLRGVLQDYSPPDHTTALPIPAGALSVERVTFQLPDMPKPLLKDVSFSLQPGEALGVVGPSGAGKSTLSRLIIGIWRPTGGHVRLDGADVHAWERTAFGRHVGYLPQDTELFTGTVRDNIARFRSDVTDAAVVQAAQDAGVHDLIVRLPHGYETPLGANGMVLSVGQRQRLGLARALLGEPSLVVLDEPNANLDTEGEAALLQALASLKARGATVVIVSHRASVFRHVDKMLVMRDGQVEAFGSRDAILARIMRPAPAAPRSTPEVASSPAPAAVAAPADKTAEDVG